MIIKKWFLDVVRDEEGVVNLSVFVLEHLIKSTDNKR